jgi:SAM-dependent methyltransferase
MQQSIAQENRQYFDRGYTQIQSQLSVESSRDLYESNPLWQHYARSLRRWVAAQRLQGRRVLEIGCGLGLMQDLVDDYVGIDIAWSAGAYLHKPFLAASATDLPFASSSFDGIWSIWVLEHIPEPERMLLEIERVLKPGGVLFLCAAWEVPPWVAQGLDVRPFRDLGWRERAIKATLPLRAARPYRQAAVLLRRLRRLFAQARGGGERVDYRSLTPNFEVYWSSDADACTSIDSQAAWLWFRRRGFQSLDTQSALGSLFLRHTEPLCFRKPV